MYEVEGDVYGSDAEWQDCRVREDSGASKPGLNTCSAAFHLCDLG